MPESFDALVACLRATDLTVDLGEIRHALAAAERAAPGPDAEVWGERLLRAGADLGLRVSLRELTPAAAIAAVQPELPVLSFRPDPKRPGGGEWIVLQASGWGRIQLAGLRPGEHDRWVGKGELARRLARAGGKEPRTWALVQAQAPCEPLARHHGHRLGFGAAEHGVPQPWQRLIRLLRPDAHDVRVVVLFALVVVILSLATPLAVESLVMTVAMNLLIQQLVVLALILFVCLALASAIRALQTYVVEVIQRRLFARIADDMAHRLPRTRVEGYGEAYAPEVVNRFFDILTVQKVAAALLLDGTTIVIQAGVGLLVLAFYHPYLMSFGLVVLITMVACIFLLGRGAVRTSIDESFAKYDLVARLEELARSPVAFRSPAGQEFALDRTDVLTRLYLKSRIAHFRILMGQILFALGFQAIASTALLGLGGWLVIQQQLTLGQLVAAELIVTVVVGSFAKLGKQLEGWYDLMAAMNKLGILIDLPLERSGGEWPEEGGPERGARLSIRGLEYAYDEHDHEGPAHGHSHNVPDHAIRGLDLEVEPGERLAIVGPGGSGKTTLADLIYGLREPTRGRIELDGLNIRDLNLGHVREQVVLVKGVEVLETSILENVRLGRHEILVSDVRDAIEAVGLGRDLVRWPDGLHTPLAATGAPLSLGQVRRLMLARAIAGRPRLLVLDEALDGLDLVARGHVLDRLCDPSAPWTLVVITHDPEVARRCGRVVALEDGRLDRTMPHSNGHAPRLEDWLKEARR